MKNEDQKNNAEASGEKQNNSTTNDIRSRLRKNPNKTKLLYTDDFTEKKNKQKKNPDLQNSLEIAKNILEELKQDEKSTLFRQPAKRSLENEKDRNVYTSKISEPRDLGNITKKIKSKKYSLKEFFDDLELCWSNAEKFNDENSEAFANAKYMRELTHKLFKEKGVLDLVFNVKNSVKEENNTFSNPQIEVSEEPIKSINNNNIVGKKRKRTDTSNDIEKVKNFNNENFNFNNTNNNNVKNKKRGNVSKNTLSIKDVKTKLNIKNDVPFLTTITNIPTLFGQKPLDNKFNNILNNKSHKNHHTSATHFTHKNKNKNINIKISDLEKYRKITFEWKEEIKPTVPKKFLIQKTNINISNFEEEKKQMNLYDENCNIENVYDLSSYKLYMNKTQIQQNEQSKKQKLRNDNIKQNNYNFNYNINKIPLDKQIGNTYNNFNNIIERKESVSQNIKKVKVSTEKENENLRMKHLIAKQLDKLSDGNIVDVLVYIENIRPNAIKLFPNDTIYIDMDLFSTETINKLIEYLKKFS